MTYGVVGFIAIILLSIMLHEAGHFLTAKAFRMKATEFFVGFGPRLWSLRRGETEYGIKAIPAGGYVRIVGMTDQEVLEPADEPRAFYRQAAWKRLIVMSAGSAMHFVIAFALFAGVFWLTDQQRATTTIGTVSACVSDNAECPADAPVSPAQAAGLRTGDRVLSVDGAAVTDWEHFVEMIQGSGGREITVVVERDGAEVALAASPVVREVADRDNPGRTREAGWLGISSRPETFRLGAVESVRESGATIGEATKLTFQTLASIPSKIPDLWDATVNGAERGLDDPVGVVGVGRISGELVARDALPEFLLLMAGLNVIIGIFNMLPLLPLDGGHVALLLIEKIRSVGYRLVGRRDPGRLDPAKLMPAAYLFLLLLIGLTVLLLAADIVNPVRLPS